MVRENELPHGGMHSSGDPRDARSRVRSARQLVWQFFQLLAPFRRQVFWILASATAATLIGLLPPAATKFIVDYGLSGKPVPEAWLRRFPSLSDPRHLLLVTVIAVALTSFVKILVHIWGRWYATKMSKQIQLNLRRRVFEHAVRLPLHRVQEIRSGGVASILREDGGSVGELVFGMMFDPWRAVIQLIGSLAILAWVDWTLLVGGDRVAAGRVSYSSNLDQQHSASVSRDSQAARTDRRRRHRVVRRDADRAGLQPAKTRGGSLYDREQPDGTAGTLRLVVDARRGNGLGRAHSHRQRRTAFLRRLARPRRSHDRRRSDDVPGLPADAAGTARHARAKRHSVSKQPERARPRARSVGRTREMPSTPGALKVDRRSIAGRISFENVTFTYPGGESPALRDICLSIAAGQTVALVGPSGAGKTTLTNLVARFYDPDAGRVTLDGRDLRDYEVESFRSLLGIVEQDVFLFDGTIAQNIAYARRDATSEEIRAAAEAANAAEFIDRMADGMQTRDRRARRATKRRSAAAAGDRPRDLGRSQGADPRRSHQQSRYRQ